LFGPSFDFLHILVCQIGEDFDFIEYIFVDEFSIEVFQLIIFANDGPVIFDVFSFHRLAIEEQAPRGEDEQNRDDQKESFFL